MGKILLTEKEKELLTLIGRSPQVTTKGLVQSAQYKRSSSIARKIGQFKMRNMLRGPFYDLDFGRLSRNTLSILVCIIEFDQDYETVISYLQLIETLRYVYPVLSPHKELLNAIFISSDNAATADLLQLLKDNYIITECIIRPYSHRRGLENPDLFGDPDPPLDNLLEPCDMPDLSFGSHSTTWNACDISILPYLQAGYGDSRLIEILKAERKDNNLLKYDQIKYSRKKMLEKGLIRERYVVYPFPYPECVDFELFMKTEDIVLTQRIQHNFARGARLLKEYSLCGGWGRVGIISHPRFLTGLMQKLDAIDEITRKELYQLRSIPDRGRTFDRPLVLTYFDLENQTLKYPYHQYERKIKEKLEE